ncbi:hypothetical protein NC652_039723 [Populus alba x Populus x berolinensis]|nr:hypothetical protein NC652_039723 [Populus alba x Populus x berolinensis]
MIGFFSPLFLLFSDRFLSVRPVFCVCFVLLWPSVFARLLCIISVLASVFLFVVFGSVFSVYYRRLLCVRSSLFFLGFFVRSSSLRLLVFPLLFISPVRPQFVRPGVLCVFRSPVVFYSWVFSVLFVLLFSRFALSPWSSSSSSLVPLPIPNCSCFPQFVLSSFLLVCSGPKNTKK